MNQQDVSVLRLAGHANVGEILGVDSVRHDDGESCLALRALKRETRRVCSARPQLMKGGQVVDTIFPFFCRLGRVKHNTLGARFGISIPGSYNRTKSVFYPYR